jgi:hypothetical protein
MVGRQQEPAPDPIPRAVRELRPGARDRDSRIRESLEAGVERQRAQSDDRRVAGEQRELPLQVLAAAILLLRKRAIARRRAPDRGRDQGAREPEPIASPARFGLVGEARLVQGAEKEVARLVPGEDSPRAIPSVSRRRQADDQDARPRVSEGRKRPRPVPLAAEPSGRILRRELSPADEPRAAAAGDDFALELAETVGRTGQPREYLPIRVDSARMCPFIARSTSDLNEPGASLSSLSSA